MVKYMFKHTFLFSSGLDPPGLRYLLRRPLPDLGVTVPGGREEHRGPDGGVPRAEEPAEGAALPLPPVARYEGTLNRLSRFSKVGSYALSDVSNTAEACATQSHPCTHTPRPRHAGMLPSGAGALHSHAPPPPADACRLRPRQALPHSGAGRGQQLRALRQRPRPLHHAGRNDNDKKGGQVYILVVLLLLYYFISTIVAFQY
jgi:hypothetical protein